MIMDICILEMSYEEAAKHLNIEVQVLRARLYRSQKIYSREIWRRISGTLIFPEVTSSIREVIFEIASL